MPSPPEVPGVPRERTGLAWERSALGFVALAGVVLSVAAHREAPGLLVLSTALVAVAAAVWRHGRRAYASAEVQAQPRALGLLAAATALAALVAAIVVLVRL
jgi:putative membrane protein